MKKTIGYARVSSKSQSLDIQLAELKAAGCDTIYSDKATGKNTDRPGFQKMLDHVRPGDCIVISKLDRIGRNLQDLISIVNGFKDDGIGFKVLDNAAIDTCNPAGELIFTVFAAVAQYELSLIRERTEKGRKAAIARGMTGGRPQSITSDKIAAVTTLADKIGVSAACKQLGLTRQSYYRRLRQNK